MNTVEHQFCQFKLAGYPSDVLYEAPPNNAIGHILRRPDMVAVMGMIRRRISLQLPNFCGKSFFELTNIAGSGCSGAPLFYVDRAKNWNLVGIYLGEKQIDCDGISKCQHCNMETTIKVSIPMFGYAARTDAFVDWAPSLLNGRTISEEALCGNA